MRRGLDMRLERLFARFSSEMEAEDLKKEMWAMDGQRRNAVLEQYRAAAEADIEAMALEEGLACYGAEVTFRTEEENWGRDRRSEALSVGCQGGGGSG